MRIRTAAPIASAIALFWAGSSQACIVSDGLRSLIHSGLPNPLPADTFIAEVSIDNTRELDFYSDGLRATVRRIVQGDYSGQTIVLRDNIETSCDDLFGNGTSGLVVGRVLGTERGELVIVPIKAVRGEGFRLRDGYVVPLRNPRFPLPTLRTDPDAPPSL